MIYLFVAHKKEASIIFKHFTCKRDKTFFKPLYIHEKFLLVLTHTGFTNAKESAKELFKLHPPSKNDTLVNFGICAASSQYEIGQFVEVNELLYDEEYVTLYETDINNTLRCVLEVQSTPTQTLIDMESYAIYEVAHKHFNTADMHFYKIVSDYCDPSSITPSLIDRILQNCSTKLLEKIK